jgi:hypothetical protein
MVVPGHALPEVLGNYLVQSIVEGHYSQDPALLVRHGHAQEIVFGEEVSDLFDGRGGKYAQDLFFHDGARYIMGFGLEQVAQRHDSLELT